MKGIDISNWQANLNAGTINADFVIVKATEGTGYVNAVCDKHYQQAKAAGKKLGVYHFARNGSNSARAEAEFFVNNTKGYHKEAVLVLDWEDGGNVANTAWAKQWLDIVQQLTGVKPLIYMSESVVNSHDWTEVVKADYGLWVAKYRDNVADFNYNMELAGARPSVKYWPFYAIWQWTSSGRLDGYDANLDLNEAYLTAEQWDKYAGGKAVGTVVTPAPVTPTPAPAQQPQTQTYTVQPGDNLSAIAAKFGTNYQTLAAINGLANPSLIYPGQVLRVVGQAQTTPTYTVRRGDILSTIASNNGTTWQNLQRINGLANPDLIYPGQVLRLR